jgi:sugar phosphate isomerase/epimerase
LKYRLHRQVTLDATTFPTVRDLLPSLREQGFGLDLMLSDTQFNRDVAFKDLEELRRHLADEEIPVSCHLPYIDLHLGSRDMRTHEYARDCLQEGLEMAGVLHCRMAVLHAGFGSHIPPKRREEWKRRYAEGVHELLKSAEEEEIILALENTYEPDGDLLHDILDMVGSPYLRFCVDLGHAACYSRMAPEEWIASFKDRIVLMHFHDNDGQEDLHQACGEGVVGYQPVFEACAAAKLSCPVVLEVGNDAWESSVEHLAQIGFEFGEVPEPTP